MKPLDLTGKKFGRLVVVSRAKNRVSASGRSYSAWLCNCECGASSVVRTDNLRSGQVQSCGCSKIEPIDLAGQVFGRLTVIRRGGKDRFSNALWLCNCSCGNEHIASTSALRSGDVKSCGCLQREVTSSSGASRAIHGHNGRGGVTPTYVSWSAMIQRCCNPKNPKFPEYGERGIRVVERWRRFENFLQDMGERPLGTTLDRFPDNDGNYEPGNCRWATPVQQARNRRPRRRLAA